MSAERETEVAADSGADRVIDTVGEPIDVEAERRVLIDLLIYAFDRARSPGVCERLTAGMAATGVRVIRPDGAVFDPGVHETGSVEPTSDPLLHNKIAETESVGFVDRGRLIREPVVVAYQLH